MAPLLSVNRERLVTDLEDLGRIGRLRGGGLNRPSFSNADTEAREWYIGRCIEAGLTVKVDGIGNMIVSSPTMSHLSKRAAVWSGSHIDTVPNGGQFDGAVGAIAALECLRRISEEDVAVIRPVCSIVYSDEEGNYAHLLGSSALARGYSVSELEAMVGRDGDRFIDTFLATGRNLAAATSTRLDANSLHATIELHIEQGPTLELLGHDIGIVTGIVGLGGGVVTFRGRADHAGTTPMSLRRDALVSAASFIARMPDLAMSISDRAVVTCGRVEIEPGSSNVVPELARVAVDFREPELSRVEDTKSAIVVAARLIASENGLDVEVAFEDTIPPAQMDLGIQNMIADSVAARGLSSSSLPSGAGHDSQNMASLAPTSMIFVPSQGGRSHCPEENTSWSDVENGANVLLDTIVGLANT